eukprot:3240279-Rhodomonas_salina.1
MANATVKGAYMVEAGLPAKDMDLAFALLRIDDVFSKYDKEKNTLLDKHEVAMFLSSCAMPGTELADHVTSCEEPWTGCGSRQRRSKSSSFCRMRPPRKGWTSTNLKGAHPFHPLSFPSRT